MRLVHFSIACFMIFAIPRALNAGPAGNTLNGIVTWSGAPGKPKPLDLSKDPACAKLRAADPVYDESLVAGAGNTLANVVIYISAGDPDAAAAPAQAKAVTFDQQGCHYTTHVLPLQAGQEIKISNNDPVAHSIHPMAKTNREWNHLQPPGTPPFSYSYEKEEIIPVKCNLHPWMQGFFVVLRTSHFTITGENGLFRLQNLPPGKYTITAWHETLGTQSQEVTFTENETHTIYFRFAPKP